MLDMTPINYIDIQGNKASRISSNLTLENDGLGKYYVIFPPLETENFEKIIFNSIKCNSLPNYNHGDTVFARIFFLFVPIKKLSRSDKGFKR